MSGWIKFEKDLLTDPRVLRIAKTLSERWKLYEETSDNEMFSAGNDAPLPAVTLVCGALVRIWSLADTHIDPNNVLPLGKTELDEIIGIEGFCGILPSEWMIEIDDHHVELPDFLEHNGTQAKKKAVTQKRVARHRAKALQVGNGRALPDQTKTRPDQDQTKEDAKPIAPSGAFDQFWTAYPRKKSKGQAERAWLKVKPNEQLTAAILAGVERAKTSADWLKDDGKFIPHPATWLNARGWEDEAAQPQRPKADL